MEPASEPTSRGTAVVFIAAQFAAIAIVIAARQSFVKMSADRGRPLLRKYLRFFSRKSWTSIAKKRFSRHFAARSIPFCMARQVSRSRRTGHP